MALQYLSPVTVAAKFFSQSMDSLGNKFDALDPELIDILGSIKEKIDGFLDKNANNVIVGSHRTQLVKLDRLQHLERSFHCGYCNKKLGKDVEIATLHYTKCCSPNHTSKPKKNGEIPSKNRKIYDIRQRVNDSVVIKKKTASLLRMDFTALCKFLHENVATGAKLKVLPDYGLIETDIKEILKPIYPTSSIKIYTFGSRMSGIGTRVSDLDIYIDIGERYRTYEHRPTKQFMEPLCKLHTAMGTRKRSWKGITFIDGARVPILKTIHVMTGIECDINVTNSLGHINTQFLEYIFSLQPLAKLMCMYMKCWLARTKVKSDISTYATNLMVIFCLQQINLLPPLSKFFETLDTDTTLMVGPWKTTFVRYTLKDLNLEKGDIKDLLIYIKCFFEFYSKFDYDKLISTYMGQAYEKGTLNDYMPQHYIRYTEADSPNMEIQMNKPLIIQDPIELNNNVAKGLSDYGLAVFTKYMALSFEFMAEGQNN